MKRSLLVIVLALFCSACASYYHTHGKFNRFFEDGELEKAEKVLEGNRKASKGKARLLYYMNLGVVASMQGKYQASNELFDQAYTLGEDLRNNYWNTATSLLINPTLTFYTGEDHELLLIHYYKALNFLMLGDHASALVECKRLNIKLNKLSSKYKAGLSGVQGKYTRDAFIHTLMGIIYEANDDHNNAFIAYRNAVEIYQEDYLPMFGIETPNQLKEDLLRTAYLTGFDSELKFYEKQFGKKYKHTKQDEGSLVFFWNNGLVPIKSEWGINFGLVRGAGGLVTFHEEQLGWNFPFQLESDEDYEKKGLADLQIIRVAFPKYTARPALFDHACLGSVNGKSTLEKAEDVNAIAFCSLQQRMFKECSTSLLRVALKKAAEYSIRQQNGDLGAVVGIVNALTEKADTRNWQTIPHTISYARVRLPEGVQEVSLALSHTRQQVKTQAHTLPLILKRTELLSFLSNRWKRRGTLFCPGTDHTCIGIH